MRESKEKNTRDNLVHCFSKKGEKPKAKMKINEKVNPAICKNCIVFHIAGFL